MLSKKIFVILALLLSLFAIAQEASAAEPTVLSADLRTWTISIVAGLPDEGEDGYVSPDATELASFRSAVEQFLAENWSLADDLADAVDYEVVELHDTGDNGEIVYLLRPEAGNADGRGFFFVRPENRVQRHLVLQAPHPDADRETATLGAEIFRAGRARAFSFAGAHRCSNLGEESPCAANSDACEGVTTHRISDMAHNDDTFFEVYNEETANEETTTVTLQLHGHGSSSPEFSASDGSERIIAGNEYLPTRLARAIEDRMAQLGGTPLPAPGNSCNRSGDDDFKCGTNNIQGRFINHSTDICLLDADPGNGHFGRFVHLELSHDLRDTGSDTTLRYPRSLVVEAVLATFPREAEIGGRVWADTDENDLQSPSESGIDGVTVTLRDGNGATVATAVTDTAGGYAFPNLGEGSYQVEIAVPVGFLITGQDGGAEDVDSDVDPTTGRTAVFPLGPNDAVDVDAGLVPPGFGQIGDQVWSDLDRDGIQDTNEPGLGGVTVRLIRNDGVEIASIVTEGPGSAIGAEGSFLFDNVLPGEYKLRFEPPAGRGFTRQDPGSPDLDSDVAPQTGETEIFPIGPGVSDLSRDAGLVNNCFNVALVPFGSTWRTIRADSAIAGWEQPGFNDASWGARKQGILGYPAGGVVSVINVAGTAPPVTSYFRSTFEVSEPALFQGLTLRLLRNDGAIVYLNGVEVLRSNLPAGSIDVSTPAGSSSEEVVTANLSSALLVTGTNVLAVEIHRAGGGDSNVKLDLQLDSRVCDACRVAQLEMSTVTGTHLEQDSQGETRGSSSTQQLAGKVGDEESSLLRWTTSSTLANTEVLHAEIRFTVTRTPNANEVLFPAYPLVRAWNASQATWLTAVTGTSWGTGGAKAATDRDNANPVALFKLSVTGQGTVPLNAAGRDLIERWVSGSTVNNGLIFAASGPDAEIDLASDNTVNKPVLRVVYLKPACSQ